MVDLFSVVLSVHYGTLVCLGILIAYCVAYKGRGLKVRIQPWIIEVQLDPG